MKKLIQPSERSLVLNAFQPSGAIELPQRFAGRSDEVKQLTDALHIDGTCPVIFGERGLGKSSLANQIERIAIGDVELLDDLKLSTYAFPPGSRFTVFYLQCTDDIRNKDDLLQRLINMGKGFENVDSLPKPSVRSVESSGKVSLKFYESETKTSYEQLNILDQFVSLTVEERLIAVSEHITTARKTPVLFIVDEIDRVHDTSGLASFIKAHSSPNIRFLLVGVAHTLSSILKDHNSLDRIVRPVNIRRMEQSELVSVVSLVEEHLCNSGVSIKFEESAKETLGKLADGFPWFVHTLGQEALTNVYDQSRNLVTSSDVLAVLANLSTSRYARSLEDLYQKSVGDSMQREIVIRSFAKWGAKDIPTSDVYPICHKLRVSNPSVYVKELQQKKRGGVLSKAPFRSSGVYSFTNAMFRQYVEIRSSLYENVKTRVDETWMRRGRSDFAESN